MYPSPSPMAPTPPLPVRQGKDGAVTLPRLYHFAYVVGYVDGTVGAGPQHDPWRSHCICPDSGRIPWGIRWRMAIPAIPGCCRKRMWQGGTMWHI